MLHPARPPTHPPTQVDYDVLDIDEQRFAEDYGQFKRVVQDLERRLASIIMQVGWMGGQPAGGRGWDGCSIKWLSSCSCAPVPVAFQVRPVRLHGILHPAGL